MLSNVKKEILLGVPIHALRWADLKTVLFQFLHSQSSHMVVTVNPEILVHASRDRDYCALLNRADLLIADGVGLRIISTLLSFISKGYTPLPATLSGVDIARWLLSIAQTRNMTVTCVVWEKGRTTTADLQRTLMTIAPQARVQCIASNRAEPTQQFLQIIKQHAPAILFVGSGFPFQEQWLAKALPHLPSVRIGIGVGGTFDFWTGRARRAPQFLRTFGCEWLWRLIREPRRIMRIFRAVIIFPLLVFKEKI